MAKVVNTISAYRGLLQEDDYEIKKIAVKQLLNNISLHWTDISNDISIMYFIFNSVRTCLRINSSMTIS